MSKYTDFIINEFKIKIDDVYYYRHRYCKCGCGKRIPYPDNPLRLAHHVYDGIPKFIIGHQHFNRKLSNKFTDFLLNELKIKVDGVYYYRNRYCKCGCGKRIPYPESPSALNTHIYRVIPEFINKHQNFGRKLSKNHKKKISQAMSRRICSPEETMNRMIMCMILNDKKR